MDLLTVGKIGGTHHLKGAVKLHSSIKDLEKIIGSKVLVELSEENVKMMTVKSVEHLMADKWVLEFEEITNKTDAAKLTKAFVKARRDVLGIEEDEYLMNDLLDMEVIDENGQVVGKVVNIFDTAAYEILEIESDTHEGMVPNIDVFVKNIDFEKGIITVSLLEGMLEPKKV